MKFKVGDMVHPCNTSFAFMKLDQIWKVTEAHPNFYKIENLEIQPNPNNTSNGWTMFENEIKRANSYIIKQRLGVK